MNDLIFRSDALKALSKGEGCGNICSRAIRRILAVDAAPTIHAQWIEEPDRYHHWHCSACGFVEGIVSKFYHYCPHCGAKMDGGDDDADG